MKKVVKSLFALLFFIPSITGSYAADTGNKPDIKTIDNYIAVFDFEVTTSDKGIARPLTESVRREIVLSGKYKVIDRGNMEKILGEQKFHMSGCVAGECIVEAGQLLGVGKLISGTVSMVGKTYYLTLSLISVKTGEVENVAEDTCKCEVDELIGSTKRLSKKLLGEKADQPVASEPTPVSSTVSRQSEQQQKIVEIAKDGRFIAYGNETVLDTQTNLMWAAKDNGGNIKWTDAKVYCENYRGGGYTDWRMPAQNELASLYDASKSYASGCGWSVHLTELIRLSCTWAWASETSGSDKASFSFYTGIRYWKLPLSSILYDPRALPVRVNK
jgi:hypothetical protein